MNLHMVPNDGRCPYLRNMGPMISSDAHLVMQFVAQVPQNAILIGICMSGLFEAKFLVASWATDNFETYSPSAHGESFDVQVLAFQNNPFGLSLCEKITVSVGLLEPPYDDTSNMLGLMFDDQHRPYYVAIMLNRSHTHTGAKRSRIKRVVLSTGEVLNHENSMRAVVSWLDKHNQELSANYNVSKLVWCEEANSVRNDRKICRTFYRVDINDNNKKKVCPNASAAIEYMQEFTKSDCYQDLLHKSDEYAL